MSQNPNDVIKNTVSKIHVSLSNHRKKRKKKRNEENHDVETLRSLPWWDIFGTPCKYSLKRARLYVERVHVETYIDFLMHFHVNPGGLKVSKCADSEDSQALQSTLSFSLSRTYRFAFLSFFFHLRIFFVRSFAYTNYLRFSLELQVSLKRVQIKETRVRKKFRWEKKKKKKKKKKKDRIEQKDERGSEVRRGWGVCQR